jgi:HTH-type transcriptional regulator / antitoxin HipB
MSFPLRLSGQLRQHLRALRKGCGLTQAQLGALIGVKQARIAEIEANPGAVSLDQLTKVLAALGGTLHLHSADQAATPAPGVIADAQVTRRKARVAPASKAARRTGVAIQPKKGAW